MGPVVWCGHRMIQRRGRLRYFSCNSSPSSAITAISEVSLSLSLSPPVIVCIIVILSYFFQVFFFYLLSYLLRTILYSCAPRTTRLFIRLYYYYYYILKYAYSKPIRSHTSSRTPHRISHNIGTIQYI